MRKNISKLLFVLGLLIFLFPFAIRLLSHYYQTKVIYNYKDDIMALDLEELAIREKQANEFNDMIADEEPIISIGDEIVENKEAKNTFDFLKHGEVIGNLKIDKINLNLPIYDGLEDNYLEKGAVHLKDTSYPTGQNSTHSVIVGHSGLTRTKLLDDIDKLEIGDNFQIDYLGETSNYEVIDIKTVLPSETDSLKIYENKTLVTLVTCTPKGVNTHRLLVTGQKADSLNNIVNENNNVENEDNNVEVDNNIENGKNMDFLKSSYIYIFIVVSIIIFLVMIIIIKKVNKK